MRVETVTHIPRFPDRAHDAHKGEVGRIVVVGGRFDDVGMVGAPALVADAAFRCGAGLVQILTTPEAQLPVSILAPCATTRVLRSGDEGKLAAIAGEFDADVVAIGPGLSPQVQGGHVLSLVGEFSGSVVVDADGLNALAALDDWRATGHGQVILTPHVGEMRRLIGEPDCKLHTNAKRRKIAETLAGRTRTIVVLKGAGTVVTDGDWTYLNTTGHPGMATAGAGDVLTGVIAALCGQGMNAFDAAVLGTYLHGRAGELAAGWEGEVSVMATDIVEGLKDAVDEHMDGGDEVIA
jgi:hydroxyethylthiazole kinase-like uncharacterized protein yjeF